jgi:hypothetical protein
MKNAASPISAKSITIAGEIDERYLFMIDLLLAGT